MEDKNMMEKLANSKEESKIVLNLEDEAKRLSELTGVPIQVSLAFVFAEDRYFDLIGLNIYDDRFEPFGKHKSLNEQKQDCSKNGTGLFCSNYYLIGGNFD